MKQVLQYILNHPLNNNRKLQAACKFFIWQLKSRLWNKPYIHQFTSKSKLIVKRGMTGATGNLYCGLHEFEDMAFLLHFLRPEDNFIDIGANIGSYTILASAHCKANTISVEPVPSTYYWLKKNIEINALREKVQLLNCAVTKSFENLKFTKTHDTTNHVAISSDGLSEVIDAEGILLNKICQNVSPDLMKIDVEGFETNVIMGGRKTLENSKLKCIIIELNGCGERYGFNDAFIHTSLMEYGFSPYTYNPFNRKLEALETYGSNNTIYIRDLDFVQSRLTGSEKLNMHGLQF